MRSMHFLLDAVLLALPTVGVGLEILAYAKPVCASSHQLAVRRTAEALAEAGHNVLLLEPSSAASKAWTAAANASLPNSLEIWHIGGLMSDEEFSRRFQEGESFQRLAQEVNAQLLPWALPRLRGRERKFDLAVVDALYPILARELKLPSVHLQCSSDPDAMSAAWFHYGVTAASTGQINRDRILEVIRNLRFVMLWLASWLFVGSHQDVPASEGIEGKGSLLWGAYYRHYVRAVLFQGSPDFALPAQAASLVSAHSSTLGFVGSLTARPSARPPQEEDLPSERLALVAFGTKPNPCPLAILEALAELNLTAIVLVEACRTQAEIASLNHFMPSSRDQNAWLHAPGLQLAVVHGGIHSLLEAVTAGVPVACVPHEGDQANNCRELQRQRLGWAMQRTVEAQEAGQVFRQLLHEGDGKNHARVAAASLAAGGPTAVAGWVQQLEPSLSSWPGMRPMPFFAAPLAWAEGWVLLLPAGIAVFSALIAAIQCLVPGKEIKLD